VPTQTLPAESHWGWWLLGGGLLLMLLASGLGRIAYQRLRREMLSKRQDRER
jgi:hypothetical protein